MSEIHLVEASIEIDYEIEREDSEAFEKEYFDLGESENDAIGQWIRNARGKRELYESDPVLLSLLVELYRKIDRLEQRLFNEIPNRLPLASHAKIVRIGFDHFELDEPLLSSGEHYYGRLEMPVHPTRMVSFYFEALSPVLARIVRMHQKEVNEWGSYVMSRERAIIRHLKGYE